MKNFESLLQEIRSLAKSITKEDFEQDLKEYNEIYNRRSCNLILSFNHNENYTVNSQYLSANAFNVFTDNTYVKVG